MGLSMAVLSLIVVGGIFGILLAIPLVGFLFGMLKKKKPVEMQSSAEKGEMVVPKVTIQEAQDSQGTLETPNTTKATTNT